MNKKSATLKTALSNTKLPEEGNDRADDYDINNQYGFDGCIVSGIFGPVFINNNW